MTAARLKAAIVTREYPPEVYGGAGVHVAELVKALRRDVEVQVRAFGAPRSEADVTSYPVPAELAVANASLQTLGTDLAIAQDVVGADLVQEVEELMRTESVGLDDAAPVGIERRGALVARTDAVAPVIFVGEAAAGPAHVRHLDGLESRDHVIADAAGVGDFRIRPDPHAFVHAAAEMLGELTEEMAIDFRAGFRDVDGQAYGVVRGLGAEARRGDSERGQRAEHGARYVFHDHSPSVRNAGQR